jgi:hypothetical protein
MDRWVEQYGDEETASEAADVGKVVDDIRNEAVPHAQSMSMTNLSIYAPYRKSNDQLQNQKEQFLLGRLLDAPMRD